MAQAQTQDTNTAQPPVRKWVALSLKTAEEAAKVPLPWQRGQKRAALRARLRASVEDLSRV